MTDAPKPAPAPEPVTAVLMPITIQPRVPAAEKKD
jgi:hypothetical protein